MTVYEELVGYLRKNDLAGLEPLYKEHIKTEEDAEQFLTYLEGQEDSFNLQDRYTELLFNLKKFERAKFICTQLLLKEPHNDALQANYANLLRILKEYDEAKIIYKKLLKKDNINPSLKLSYAWLLVDLGEYQKAKEISKQLLDKNPTDFESRWNYATILYNLKEYEEAKIICQKLIEEKPFSLHLKDCYARILFEQKKYQEAKEILEQMLDQDPKNFEIRHNYLNILGSLNEYGKAKELCQQLLNDKPEDFTIQNAYATVLLGLQEYQQAKNIFEQLLKKEPNDFVLQFNYANLLYRLKDYKKAKELYEKLLGEQPDHFLLRNNYAGLLYNLGKYVQSKQIYEDLLQKESSNFDLRFNYAHLLFDFKKYKQSKEIYEELLKEEPSSFILRFNYAATLGNLKEHLNAKKIFASLLGEEPENFVLQLQYANTLYFLKEFEAVKIIYEKLIYYYPENFMLKLNLALTLEYLKNDKYQIALKTLNKLGIFGDIFKNENKANTMKISIALKVLKVLECLMLKGNFILSHYTSNKTAHIFLDNEPKSYIRLNSTLNVNDHNEGKTLLQLLNINIPHEIQNDDGYRAFISCFSFRIDDLNQYRLYAKDDGKEAAGVCFVPHSSFFDARYEYNLYSAYITPSNQELFDPLMYTQQEGNKHELNIHPPLFSCVYIDPTHSDYALLSQQDIYTASRYNELFSQDLSHGERQQAHKDHQQQSQANNDKVYAALMELKEYVENYKKQHDDASWYQELYPLLRPIAFLVKDAAYRDEQECRILTIKPLHSCKNRTADCGNKACNSCENFSNPVQRDADGKNFFINYEKDLSEHMDTVYLAPQHTNPDYMKALPKYTNKNYQVRHSAHGFKKH